MEERLIEFIAGLRAAGVRISVAESSDSFRAIQEIGVDDRDVFRAALSATLVKDPSDVEVFARLFPQYFGQDAAGDVAGWREHDPDERQELSDALDGLPADLAELLRQLMEQQQLNPDQMQQMRQQLQQQAMQNWQKGEQQYQDLMSQLAQALRSRLAQLLNHLMTGTPATEEELEQLGREVGLQRANHPYQQQSMTDRMLRAMGMDKLAELLEEILEQLAQQGMGKEALDKLSETMQENLRRLASRSATSSAPASRQVANQQPQPSRVEDLMQRPFQSLTQQEAALLRQEVRRMAARLRSRASLRHRRGKTGLLDPKATVRANLRYGGVPVDLRHKQRHLKPKLVLICDISTSMRPVVQFLLQLIYELQDQVAWRSFVFIDDVTEITNHFAEMRPEKAIQHVLDTMPPGYYNTDLGFSLVHFGREHLDAVDARTTVIIVGDGRNNYKPRLDAVDDIRRRCRRMLWFNPEPPISWGTGDSDMPKYLPYCSAVHQVGNLSQLIDAVDKLFD